MAFEGFASPVPPTATFARVDQGVDYDSPEPYMAAGSGVVLHISGPGSWSGGTGEAVYITLDVPIIVGGRSYSQVYYAERHPLVGLGDRVIAGQPVMGAGSAEIGFARGNSPSCALVGGLGAGTQPTVCGYDFQRFVAGVRAELAPATRARPPKRIRKVVSVPGTRHSATPTSLPEAHMLLMHVLAESVPNNSKSISDYALAIGRAAAPRRKVRK